VGACPTDLAGSAERVEFTKFVKEAPKSASLLDGDEQGFQSGDGMFGQLNLVPRLFATCTVALLQTRRSPPRRLAGANFRS
jgi:hypothetical protein